MKIIRIDSYPHDNPVTGSLMPDSSLRPDRRPLFLPEGEWVCEIRPAVRINRLGKAISAKFAKRYYSDFALVNYLKPLKGGESIVNDTMDDAVVQGAWAPIENHPEALKTGNMDIPLCLDTDYIGRLIEFLSAHTTFKTGDIIILPSVLLTYTPAVNMKVRIDSQPDMNPLLEFTIK